MTLINEDLNLLDWTRETDFTPTINWGYRYSMPVYDPITTGWRNFYTEGDFDIGTALSDNPMVWGKHSTALTRGTAPAWDTTQTLTPCVWCESGEARPWRMIYAGQSGLAQIGLATSITGSIFEKVDTTGGTLSAPVLTGSLSYDLGGIMKTGNIYHMYYNTISSPRQILLATSTDLKTWTNYAGNPLWRATVGPDISGATVNNNRGRFCGDIVRWDRDDGTERYVALIPHYTATDTLPETEVYTCPNPYFSLADRDYVGVAWNSTDVDNVWDTGVTMNSDVIRIITDDITRNVTTSTLTQNKVYAHTAFLAGSYGYGDTVYTHDKNLHGSTFDHTNSNLPLDNPTYGLEPSGDASTVALYLPGLTKTLLDLSGNGLHLTLSGSGNYIDSDGYHVTRANSDFARRRTSGGFAALNAVNTDFTIEFTATMSPALEDAQFAGILVYWKDNTPYHFMVRLAGSTAGTGYKWSFIGTVGGSNVTTAMPTGFTWDGSRAQFAIVKSSGKIYFFKDGTLLNVGGTAHAGVLDNVTNTAQLILGSSGTTGQYWPGIIDEVRISNVAKWTADYTAVPLSLTYATRGTLISKWQDAHPSWSPTSPVVMTDWANFSATTSIPSGDTITAVVEASNDGVRVSDSYSVALSSGVNSVALSGNLDASKYIRTSFYLQNTGVNDLSTPTVSDVSFSGNSAGVDAVYTIGISGIAIYNGGITINPGGYATFQISRISNLSNPTPTGLMNRYINRFDDKDYYKQV